MAIVWSARAEGCEPNLAIENRAAHMKRLFFRTTLALSAGALAACTAQYVQPEGGPVATLITTVVGDIGVGMYLAKEAQQCASSESMSRWHYQFFNLGAITNIPPRSKADAAMRKLDKVEQQHQMLIRADVEAFIRGAGTLPGAVPGGIYYSCDAMTAFKPVAGRIYKSVWTTSFKTCSLKIESSVDGVNFVPEPSARSIRFCPAPWP